MHVYVYVLKIRFVLKIAGFNHSSDVVVSTVKALPRKIENLNFPIYNTNIQIFTLILKASALENVLNPYSTAM